MRGTKPLSRAASKTGITASPEFQEGVTMHDWKVLPHVWAMLQRAERLYMMSISEGIARVNNATLED
jgi:hypothetical protein